MTRVAFRLDASAAIGTGHLMRCLALADALAARGADTTLLARNLPPALADLVGRQGHRLVQLDVGPQEHDAQATLTALRGLGGVDWLVVDHYGLGADWERTAAAAAERVLVIDDLADRPHDCHALLDQTLADATADRYAGLLPARCRTLLGPRFALLRPQFAAARAALRPRDGGIRRILVAFGGSDPGNETAKALEALEQLARPELSVDVVLGAASPHVEDIRARAARLPQTRLLLQVADMAGLMSAADLAIGGGGITTWERCCLALPTLAIAIAGNQVGGLEAAGRAGALLYLGPASAVSAASVRDALATLLRAPSLMRAMSSAAGAVCDGQGCERVAAALLSGDAGRIVLRPATMADAERLLAWRNDPVARANSLDGGEIALEQHRAWLARVLADPMHLVLVGEIAGRPFGVVRFASRGDASRVSIALGAAERGRGLGGRLLAEGCARLFAAHPEVETIEADILPGNVASQRIFSACGFAPAKVCYTLSRPRTPASETSSGNG